MANRIKERLADRHLQLGMWLALASPAVAEIAGNAGFDWCLIDAEHGPSDIAMVLEQLRVLQGTACDAVVRIPNQDPWMLKKVLDIGAQTIMVPMVNSAAEARAIVRATRYPPEGTRGVGATLSRASGYGADDSYIDTASDDICLILQVESSEALSNLTAIATTSGVDAVFIGPADLAADMGFPGNPMEPSVQDAISQANTELEALGMPSGTVVFDPSAVPGQIEQGVTFLGVGGDAILVTKAMRGKVAETRALVS